MKKAIKLLVVIAISFVFPTLYSCSEEDVSKSCIESPCGTIQDGLTNLTITFNEAQNIGNIGLVVDEQEAVLSLDGWTPDEEQYFTCWQTIPTITENSTVVFGYELDGEPVIGAFNVSGISTNELVISINGDAALIADYEPCIDFQ